jgi:hypothetical protein
LAFGFLLLRCTFLKKIEKPVTVPDSTRAFLFVVWNCDVKSIENIELAYLDK